MRRLIVILAGLFFLNSADSQDFISVDSQTYAMYLAGEWDSLIVTGKQALEHDIDYFYLRIRIGIAYYEKHNYKSAVKHFTKALKLNTGDPVALEYLYYSYLYGGQQEQAGMLRNEFPQTLQQKLPPVKGKFIDRLSAEFLYSHALNDNIVTDPGKWFSGLDPGYQTLTRSFINTNVRVRHRIKPGISITQAYTYLNKSNFNYYYDGLISTVVDGLKVIQNQYYLSPCFTTPTGFSITPYFHFLRIRYQVPRDSETGFQGGNSSGFSDQFTNQYAAGLSLEQYTGKFNLRMTGNYSNLNDSKQLLGSAGITWYPGGNLNAYLGTKINVQAEITDDGTSERLIPDFMGGFGIASRVWIELSGSYGDMRNYLEGNGYIVYNSLDWMNYKVVGIIIIPVTDAGSKIYLGGRWTGHESQYVPVFPAENQDYNSITYNSISIFGGISWKF